MQKKEKTLCTFIQKGTRLQLVEVGNINLKQISRGSIYYDKKRYEVRLNRKIVSKSVFEYTERKVFATYCQNIVLQLKIY